MKSVIVDAFCFIFLSTTFTACFGEDLDAVRKNGVLRHLCIPYANFNTGAGDGLDVDLMKLFAKPFRYSELGRLLAEVNSDVESEADKPLV